MYFAGMRLHKDLMGASAAPLILSILAAGESYGYALIQRVHELSAGQIEWTDGMLYPVLHRLEAQGFVQSRWRVSESGRRREILLDQSRRQKGLGRTARTMARRTSGISEALGGVACLISKNRSSGGGNLWPAVFQAAMKRSMSWKAISARPSSESDARRQTA